MSPPTGVYTGGGAKGSCPPPLQTLKKEIKKVKKEGEKRKKRGKNTKKICPPPMILDTPQFTS